MKNKNILGVCICLCIFLLTGCGQAKEPDVIDTPAIAVADNGRIVSYLVGVFDKEYYDVSGLTDMVVKEAAAYNTEHQSGETVPVEVKKVEAMTDGSGKVVVTMEFDHWRTFSDYNSGVLFYGTVAQAQAEGYQLEGKLTDVKKNTPLTGEQMENEAGKHILITDQKVRLYCPRKVTHLSAGAVLNGDGSVDTALAEDTVYILMK